MGLDTTHDAWHGPYGAFSRWRNELAKVAGYEIVKYTYDSGFVHNTPDIDWDSQPEGRYKGNWKGVIPEDALMYLIVHSDCDGHLKPKACARLADRLEELLPALKDRQDAPGYLTKELVADTEQFIEGLRLAAKRKEKLRFH